MGTKIDCKSYLPLYYSMRDLNDDSSSSSWPLFYADKAVTNGQYYNGLMPRPTMDGYPGYAKDALKQKILEHEAVFKNQVYELHRLYRIQRDMMEEVRRKEPSCGLPDQESAEPSSSSSRRGSHLLSQDAQNWHMAGFPLTNSGYGRTPTVGLEIGCSPMIGKNEDGTQPGLFQFLNGPVSKESEASESRPLKARKKLFDLELPAPEYVDAEDKEMNGSLRGGLDCRNKLPVEDHGRLYTDSRLAALDSALGLTKSTGLADLNKPIEIEEVIAPSSVDFLGQRGDSIVTKLPVRSNAGRLGENGETMHLRNGFIFNSIRSKESDAGSSKTAPYASGHRSRMYLNGYGGIDLSRNGSRHCLESCDRSDYSNSGMLMARQASHSVPPWAKLKSSLLPRTHALEPALNSSVSMDQAVLNSSHSHEPFGGNWQARLHPGSVGEQTSANGFYQGSPLGSKDVRVHLPASGFDGFHYRKSSSAIPPCSYNGGFLNMPKGLCRADSNRVLDINLNDVVSKGSSNDAVIVQEKVQPVDHKSAIPPWLTRKPSDAEATDSRKSEVFGNSSYRHDSSTEMGCESKTVRDLNQPLVPNILSVSNDCRIPDGKGIDAVKDKKNGMIDINLEYEPDDEMFEESIVEKEEQAKPAPVSQRIDLNCCAIDDEDTLTLEIDLEAPILTSFQENTKDEAVEASLNSLENYKSESLPDGILSDAAEALIAISSFHPQIHEEEHAVDEPEASLADTFLSFVDALVSYSNQLNFPVEIDEFEAATLRLPEMKGEDCMPTPFVLNETGVSAVGAASRRVQSRRGRQRRDFQRDILPGIVSLSRHEVTEDVQIFAGLMRATGHHWNSGLTRRNGARNGVSRGRRRAVVEPVAAVAQTAAASAPPVGKIGACLVERSLMGWGKTTRRPRRQRCHTAAASAAAAAAVLS